MTTNTSQHAFEETPLPRPPGAVRRLLVARPLLVDGTIAGGYLLGCLLMALFDFASTETVVSDTLGIELIPDFGVPRYLTLPWVLLVLLKTTAVFMSLLWRRRYPLIALSVIAVVVLLSNPDFSQMIADNIALVFAVYAVPVYSTVVRGWIGYGIATLATALNPLIYAQPLLVGGLVTSAMFLVLVLLVGINFGNRRRYVGALLDRAERLQREREQLARIAVADERERIAREMHDIVAHSLSVMIALSEGSARAATASPEAAINAMERSAETGRSALTEMRRLLGALTEPGVDSDPRGDLSPQPGLTALPHLVQSFRDAGIEVRFSTQGVAPADQGFELAIYRIVQESLTNVLRYAGTGATTELLVDHQAERTVIVVRDYGSVGAHPTMSGLGSGSGLKGLEERARVFGGTLEAGPKVGGGWQVRAELPRPGTPGQFFARRGEQ